MIFRIRAVSDLLEPCEIKVSSPVLRGEAGGDTCFLPGGWKRAGIGTSPAAYSTGPPDIPANAVRKVPTCARHLTTLT
jgi:hypothetical protein